MHTSQPNRVGSHHRRDPRTVRTGQRHGSRRRAPSPATASQWTTTAGPCPCRRSARARAHRRTRAATLSRRDPRPPWSREALAWGRWRIGCLRAAPPSPSPPWTRVPAARPQQQVSCGCRRRREKASLRPANLGQMWRGLGCQRSEPDAVFIDISRV